MSSLSDIGFYTLSDERCRNSSHTSPLWRCELILTDRCTFKCPYCRGLRKDISGTMPFERAKEIVDIWANNGLKNIRLSGGEPTVYPNIVELVEYIKFRGVERIAISTNGFSKSTLYDDLIRAGVNDFSVSLDACCSSVGDIMAGGIRGAWERVCENIRHMSQLTYVTVGVVVTDETIDSLPQTIKFASELGVADIRIISAAQWDNILETALAIDESVYEKYPILKYRIQNIKNGRSVRGIKDTDSHRCGLSLDDMAVAGNYHFPCIIYMREGGDPVGKIGKDVREQRLNWMKNHNTHEDAICSKNCLDVCVDYNNRFASLHDDKRGNL